MAIDLVRYGKYFILSHTQDEWYSAIPEVDRNLSMYDFAKERRPPEPDASLEYTLIDAKKKPFELALAFYCKNFNRFTLCDVGSHYGTVMMDMAQVVISNNGNADMFAFDAGSASELTWRNFENNLYNIDFARVAVGPIDGHVPMFIDSGESVNNRLVNGRGEGVAVKCVRLDTYLRNKIGVQPACIKVDVQGAEPGVLAGMVDLLEAVPTTLQLEFTPWAMRDSGIDPIIYINDLLSKNYIFDIGFQRQHIRQVSDGQEATSFVDESWPHWTDILVIPKNLANVSELLSRLI